MTRVGMRASDFGAVRVEQHIQQVLDKKTTRGTQFHGMRLYWARAEDVKADPKWPFSDDRCVAFVQEDKANPEVWCARAAGHKEWNGKIERLMVMLDVPQENLSGKKEYFNVIAKRYEFLK